MYGRDLKAKIDEHIRALADATSAASRSDAFMSWLSSMSKFHRYSLGNQLLILWANPDATRVAGFHAWKKLGRFVKRGEHGIPILAPVIVKHTDPDDPSATYSRIAYYKTVFVFDVSQTEGDPLPDLEWKSLEKDQELFQRLVEFANARGYDVEVKSHHGSIQGSTDGRTLWVDPDAGTKTLIHELAHAMCGHVAEHANKATSELEAESVAYVVSQHFGLPSAGSPNYLATYLSEPGVILQHMGRIREIAITIIGGLETDDDADEKEG